MSFHLAARVCLVFVLMLSLVSVVEAGPFFNSSECPTNPNGSPVDGNLLFCDDFETGIWYSCTGNGTGDSDINVTPDPGCVAQCGSASNPTFPNAESKGWCGTVYNNDPTEPVFNTGYGPIVPPGAAKCGGVGAVGTTCAATSGVMSGAEGNGNMAEHALYNWQGFEEVWVRWYYKATSDYQWGTEKALTFNDNGLGGAGIKWGNWAFNNCGASQQQTQATTTFGYPNGVDTVCLQQNQGNSILIQPGRWYTFQIQMKLSTPGQSDGRFALYIDDCGTNGLGCTGTPTLRQLNTNIHHNRVSTSELIRVLWWENWGNPKSTGTEALYDQIKVSKVGPIPFMGAGPIVSPPAMPTNLRIQAH